MLAIGDACARECADHGHRGILDGCEVDNDRAVELIARIVVSQTEAGADGIEPAADHVGWDHDARGTLDTAGISAYRSYPDHSRTY